MVLNGISSYKILLVGSFLFCFVVFSVSAEGVVLAKTLGNSFKNG